MFYEFAVGVCLNEYVKTGGKKEISEVLREIFRQCRVMDLLKVSKEEMLRPHKHAIIGEKLTLIDFERCRNAETPKNVTQFCQYLVNNSKVLEKKGIKIERENLILKARAYKNDQTEHNFNELLRELK